MRWSRRSAWPGLVASRVPLLLGGRDAPLLKLMGHSHMSELYSINTADHALTGAFSAFVTSLPWNRRPTWRGCDKTVPGAAPKKADVVISSAPSL